MKSLSPELETRLLDAVAQMPGFPKSVQRILELTRDVNCPPKALVEVIQKDPVITLKILKLINSAFYRLPDRITSIGQSVVYLGLNTIKNMALSFAAAGILPRTNAAGFDVQDYLMHSLVTAGVARGLCSRWASDQADPNDAYIAGLLHDFGKVVFAQHLSEEFKAALTLARTEGLPLHEAEERVIGVDHAYVGALLAERWRFSQSLVDCIAGHHQTLGKRDALRECLFAADGISEHLGHSASGQILGTGSSWSLPSRFGVSVEQVLLELGGSDKLLQDAQVYAQMN